MGRSADTSFRLIAEQKKLISRERLSEATRQAREQGVSLESVISEGGDLPPGQLERILGTRERHGRTCKGCGERTYMLPGQTPLNTPCEHCGGDLISAAGDKGRSTGRPSRPSGGAPRPSGGAPRPSGGAPRPSGGAPRPSGGAPRPSGGAPRPGGGAPRPSGGAPRPGGGAPRPSGRQGRPSGRPITSGPRKPPTISGRPLGKSSSEIAAEAASQAAAQSPLEGVTFGESDNLSPPVRPPEDDAGGADDLDFRSVAYDASTPPEAPQDATISEPPPEFSDGGTGPGPSAPAGGSGAGASGQTVGSPAPGGRRQPKVGDADYAQSLRQAGGGFGYEPTEIETVKPAGRLGVVSTPSAFVAPPGPEEDDFDEGEAGRFMPPAEDMVQVGAIRAPVPPLRSEIGRILKLPLNPHGLAMIALGAMLVFFLSAVMGRVPCIFLIPLIGLFLYPTAYLIKVMRCAMSGQEDLADWPDFDFGGLLGDGLRMAMVFVASGFPIVVGACVFGAAAGMLGGSKKKAEVVKSIGEQAHMAAGETPKIAPGTDVSDVVFLAAGQQDEVRVGEGKWTVLGLLGRSEADDTGMTQAMDDMPTGGFGISLMHAWQIYDMDRVGQAAGRDKVRVLAVYADPDERIIQSKFPWLIPPPEGDDDDDDAFDETRRASINADLQSAMDKGATLHGGRRTRQPPGVNELKVTEVVRTSGWVFPGAFEKIKRIPCVYLIDPQGKIVREYSTGAYDELIYGDLLNAMTGGDGHAQPVSLPYDIKPTGGLSIAAFATGGARVVLFILFLVFVVAGLFYYPMANILMGVFDSPTTPFFYPAGFRAMAVAWKDYLALAGVLVGLNVVAGLWGTLGSFLLGHILPWPLDGLVINSVAGCISFYSGIVSSYAIGRYYYANQEAIGWLT
jgi:hypothetical protein